MRSRSEDGRCGTARTAATLPWPIIRHTDIDDTLIVQINPVDVDRPPETARDIVNRIDEITFNASLLAETRSLQRLNDVHLVILANRAEGSAVSTFEPIAGSSGR